MAQKRGNTPLTEILGDLAITDAEYRQRSSDIADATAGMSEEDAGWWRLHESWGGIVWEEYWLVHQRGEIIDKLLQTLNPFGPPEPVDVPVTGAELAHAMESMGHTDEQAANALGGRDRSRVTRWRGQPIIKAHSPQLAKIREYIEKANALD